MSKLIIILKLRMETILFTYNLYSHPNKLLKDHLINVYNIGLSIYTKERFQSNLNFDVLQAVLLLHDFGKSSKYFQDKLFNRQEHNIELTYHSGISALILLLYLDEINVSVEDQVTGFIAIKKHHSNIIDNFSDIYIVDMEKVDDYYGKILSKIDWVEIAEIYAPYLKKDFFQKDKIKEKLINFNWRKYKKKADKFLKNNMSLKIYIKQNLYFSILVNSDKQDCIFNDRLLNKTLPNLDFDMVDNYKLNLQTKSEINLLRNESYQEVFENIDHTKSIFSINLPTGLGKTLTSLNAALQLMKFDSSLSKIIYCLPFTSIIDQNAKVFQDVLGSEDSSLMLTHHHLTEFDYKSKLSSNDTITTSNESEFLIESWNSRIIVTTFYQLLETVFSGINRMLKKFSRIPNSIIILDEVQTLPRKYWKLIKEMFLYLAKNSNIKLILVTATMPMIFSEEDGEIEELAKEKIRYFSSLNRIQLDISRLKEVVAVPAFCERLFEDINSKKSKSYLIILNTIKSSLQIFEFLKEKGLIVLYLSANVIPKERLDRIEKIKNSTKKMIVVSTQVVEAGVDIDFDVVYRDGAPLDSIFQACGRCNRNNNGAEKGVVKVVRLKDDNENEFSSYIYDSLNLQKTFEIFKNKNIINENDFYKISSEYFVAMKNITEEQTSQNVISALKHLDYENALYSKNGFRLIDNYIDSVMVFVEIDQEAEDMYCEFKNLLKKKDDFNGNYFEIAIEIKNQFRKMSSYMINVPRKSILEAGDRELYRIDKNMLEKSYSIETGFIRDSEQKDFIF